MKESIVPAIVIVGGGTSGWMTAAALSRALNGKVRITLVESDDIGTVGVGEATIPLILNFNQMLGIDENEFLRETQGTFKLGIEFQDWTRIGDRYMHGFGRLRRDIQVASFEQVWRKMHGIGRAEALAAYSVTKCAAYAGRCMRPLADATDSPLSDLGYAFHFDASLYARYLRRFAERHGVTRIEGKVVAVDRDGESGDLTSIRLADGLVVEAPFFVDCSGFRALLVEGQFAAGYDDWSHWLPCDRALAVPTRTNGPPTPYTLSIAREAGWQWRIPLQHRVGNGYVYSSRYVDDDRACATLLAGLDSEPLADPRPLRFVAGMRRESWVRNCVAVGLSAGFLEPLESTSIYLIQAAIGRILAFFPGPSPNDGEIREYNRQTRQEFEHIRDFIVLHYHATTRRDSPFWIDRAATALPDSLQARIDLFRSRGRLPSEPGQLFAYGSWFQVMTGQGIVPDDYDPLVDTMDVPDIDDYLRKLREAISASVELMPTHADFIAKNCKSIGSVALSG